MKHITDSMVDAVVTASAAQQVLSDAWRDFADGRAAMQRRVRTEARGVKLSTLGAVIPTQDVAGAKVYTTIAGQFNFVILLFSTDDGRPLATLDAAAITRWRTAACSVIAARHLARPDSQRLALLGAGVQGRAHAQQMAQAFALREIVVFDPYAQSDISAHLARECNVAVRRVSDANEAVAGADIVVTASRSTEPLFSGDSLASGSMVAAVGSSLPTTRELDDGTLARAARIAVEWKAQALEEAGDLVRAAPGLVAADKLVELGDLVNGRVSGRHNANEITLYKAVGVGLADIALAGWVYRQIARPG
jgi:ornithine cyclodeaminase